MVELGPCTQGDVEKIRYRLTGVASLAGMTAQVGHVWRNTSSAPATTLVVNVVDADECIVEVLTGSWLTAAAPGVWQYETQTTWASGETLTFPNGKPDTITVRRQGG